MKRNSCCLALGLSTISCIGAFSDVDDGSVESDSGLSTVSCIGAFSDVVVDGGGVESDSSCWWVGEDKRLTTK
ncbi:hypothetical protein L1987_18439 [Smallanthus sonchifolius]|uniref:Uncharacterized protein n=1 Tax=Smallanthus sonchifolius TaxID=185202 RepID=A0ACB9J1W7_9ASTR|nr:hypothetical protein L1987_18439 [Smallanthus sonchifolius]